MKNKIFLFFLFLFIGNALVFFCSPVLFAQVPPTGQGNLKIGPLEVHPLLGLTETYTDNLYQNYGGLPAEADLITTINPGIRLILPLRSHRLDLGYTAKINRYPANSGTDYTAQYFAGGFSFDFPSELNGNISYAYREDQIPRRAKEDPNLSGAADPYRAKPYQVKDLAARTRYRLADLWAMEGRYKYYDYTYRDPLDNLSSFHRNQLGGAIFYRISPRIRALIDYDFALVEYPFNDLNNLSSQTAYLGLDLDPAAKIVGYLKIGWAQIRYDRSAPNRKNQVSTPSALADLKYNLSPDDLVQFTARRTIQEDVDTNTTYTTDNFWLTYRHVLAWNEKVSLSASVGYQTLTFDGATVDADGSLKIRDDKGWTGGVGINYALQRWLSLELKYSRTNNNSNFINYNYKENKIWLQVVFSF